MFKANLEQEWKLDSFQGVRQQSNQNFNLICAQQRRGATDRFGKPDLAAAAGLLTQEGGQVLVGPEPVSQVEHRKPRGVPQFVAEEPVSLNAQNVQVYIPPLGGVGAEGEPQGVRAALGDPAGVVLLLPRLRLLNLPRVEVAALQRLGGSYT